MTYSSKYRDLIRLNRSISYSELDDIVRQLLSGVIIVVIKNWPYTGELSNINLTGDAWGYDTETHRYLRLTNNQRRKFLKDANAIPRDIYHKADFNIKVSLV
jgi:hypothetical protein